MAHTTLLDKIAEIAKEHGFELDRHVLGRGRYEYGLLSSAKGRAFLKAGFAQQGDYDEKKLLYNLQREVWFSQVVTAVKQRYELPFTTPAIIATNVTPNGCDDEVAWIILEYEPGRPLAGTSIWDTKEVSKDWAKEQIARFRQHIPNICHTLAMLERITPETLKQSAIPQHPPHRAHGEVAVPDNFIRYLKQRSFFSTDELTAILARLVKQRLVGQRLVLGQGDFEVSHLLVRDDGTVVITDNEFGGWYPRYDSLTYCYHRLWANRRRPELAKELLNHYVSEYVKQSRHGAFMTAFARLMLPRAIRGIYYDATRRHLSETHENQLLRKDLIAAVIARDLPTLTGSKSNST